MPSILFILNPRSCHLYVTATADGGCRHTIYKKNLGLFIRVPKLSLLYSYEFLSFLNFLIEGVMSNHWIYALYRNFITIIISIIIIIIIIIVVLLLFWIHWQHLVMKKLWWLFFGWFLDQSRTRSFQMQILDWISGSKQPVVTDTILKHFPFIF